MSVFVKDDFLTLLLDPESDFKSSDNRSKSFKKSV